MNFTNEVIDTMTQKVFALLPETVIEVKGVDKNNGKVATGLVIRSSESNLAPTIYLDNYEREIEAGEYDTVAEHIVEVYKQSIISDDFDIASFTDYSKASKNICYKLINTELNAELLENIPHIKMLDLAIVFYCVVDVYGESNVSSILIRNEHQKLWGVSMEELYNVAKENTPKLMPPTLASLAGVVKDLRPDLFDVTDEEIESSPIWVLSNKQKLYGAATLMNDELITQVADKFDDNLYVIPSSIHEVLLVPQNGQDASYLNQLVNDVNSTQVKPQEVLGTHVYAFNRRTKELSVA